jgi:hypothetical protein
MYVHVERDGELWKAVEAENERRLRSADWLAGPDAIPPATILAVPRAGDLSRAINKELDRLLAQCAGHGHSRSQLSFRADGRGCSAVVTRWNHDGSVSMWQVEAYDPRPPSMPEAEIQVKVSGPWAGSNDAEWERRLVSDRSKVVIARHCWFTIGREDAAGSRDSRGFAGHRFRFAPLDGSAEVVSTNVWFGGPVPPSWRERIPDTHTMEEGFLPGPVE